MEMHAPMMGAQRRIEARIGQLLGPAPERGVPERLITMNLFIGPSATPSAFWPKPSMESVK